MCPTTLIHDFFYTAQLVESKGPPQNAVRQAVDELLALVSPYFLTTSSLNVPRCQSSVRSLLPQAIYTKAD